MVAKQAHSSSSIKGLIAAGVDDAQWEGRYGREMGGIITLCSKPREPIHKCTLKLWKEYDDSVFKPHGEKCDTRLQERRVEVI